MTECFKCYKTLNNIPFTCNFCGEEFCPNHHLPENHGCLGLEAYKEKVGEKWRKTLEEFSKGGISKGEPIRKHIRSIPYKPERPDFEERRTFPIWIVVLILIIGFLAVNQYSIDFEESVESIKENVSDWWDKEDIEDSITYIEKIVPESLDEYKKPEINILGLEMEVHNLINNERENNGLLPLHFDSMLSDVARTHSQDMADRDYFSHDSPEGKDPTARGLAADYSCYKDHGDYYIEGLAENILQNNLYDSITYYNGIPSYDWSTQEEIAISTVSGWMNSPGHRENILTSTYENGGVGIAISSDDKVLVTQDFC